MVPPPRHRSPSRLQARPEVVSPSSWAVFASHVPQLGCPVRLAKAAQEARREASDYLVNVPVGSGVPSSRYNPPGVPCWRFCHAPHRGSVLSVGTL
mmetsp:Transcript_3036/g.7740  ORF Transcript_3036/g.7740 Transcript_3036/m.7740 type:complete len:96 (+) Transcript_3036:1336-1623(+)